jgi:isoquinoline 1-oxidoreductase alpha subunit
MISLNVNGKNYNVDVEPDADLLWVIRDHVKLTGTKYSCGIGECGCCTVQVDGKAERSCTLTVEDVQGKKITTIEGIPENNPVKKAWIQEQVVQCGYCQPGVIVQVDALLSESPNPDPKEVIENLEDVICRCGTYSRIIKGVETAAAMMRKEGA